MSFPKGGLKRFRSDASEFRMRLLDITVVGLGMILIIALYSSSRFGSVDGAFAKLRGQPFLVETVVAYRPNDDRPEYWQVRATLKSLEVETVRIVGV